MSNFASNFVAKELIKTFGDKIGPNTTWSGKDEEQTKYLHQDYDDLSMPELERESQLGGTNIVKAFLEKKGIPLDLPDKIDSGDICAAVVLDIKSKWIKKGTEIKINSDKTDSTGEPIIYDGALLSASVNKDVDGNFCARVMLTNFDFVIFEQLTNSETTTQEMEANGRYFLNTYQSGTNYARNYVSVAFPQVDLDIKRDILEIVGAASQGLRQYVVSIVKGRCMLQMNHIGAKLKMAMGGMAVTTSIRQEYSWIIKDSFCAHFCRGDYVYASIFVTPEDFKKVAIEFDEVEETEVELDEVKGLEYMDF